jgi:hypothetical protein
MPILSPAQRAVLKAAANRNVWADPAREPVRWMVGVRENARPDTPAVQALIDAGLLASDQRITHSIGTWCFATPTPAGRALLDTLNGKEPIA